MNANAIKNIDMAPDLSGTSVCIHYANGTKLHVTVPTPPPGHPIFVKDFLKAVETALYLPEGHLSQNGKLHHEFATQWVAKMPYAAEGNFVLTPVNS